MARQTAVGLDADLHGLTVSAEYPHSHFRITVVEVVIIHKIHNFLKMINILLRS